MPRSWPGWPPTRTEGETAETVADAVARVCSEGLWTGYILWAAVILWWPICLRCGRRIRPSADAGPVLSAGEEFGSSGRVRQGVIRRRVESSRPMAAGRAFDDGSVGDDDAIFSSIGSPPAWCLNVARPRSFKSASETMKPSVVEVITSRRRRVFPCLWILCP